MTTKLILFSALFLLSAGQVTHSQFTISIPKLPGIKKDKAATTSNKPTGSQEVAATSTEQQNSSAAAAPKGGNECSSMPSIDKARIEHFSENIKTTITQAREYPVGRNWFVRDFNDSRNEYLWAAISPSKKKEFSNRLGNLYPCVEPLIDELSAIAKTNLPTFKPTGFTLRNAAEEALMRGQVNDLSKAKVMKIGLGSTTWNIEKNAIGIPTRRYKHGLIWANYPGYDDGYCRIIWVNILQDYAGGGTWGSSYGMFIKSEPAGC